MTSRETYRNWGRFRNEHCPEDADLEAYRVASEREQSEHPLANHLQTCPSCINRLIDLREFAALESAQPAPETLLARVRASTQASLDPQSDLRPAAEPSPGRLDRFIRWITQPVFAGGAFAALALTFALLLLQGPGAVIDPALVPRGTTFDQASLRAALPAITADGVYARTAEKQTVLIQGTRVRSADDPPAALEPAPTGSVAIGDIVAIITPAGVAMPGRIERLGDARLDSPDLRYEGVLIGVVALSPRTDPLTDAAVLTPKARLIGVVISVADDGLLLAVPP